MSKTAVGKIDDAGLFYELSKVFTNPYDGFVIREEIENDTLSNQKDWKVVTQDKGTHSFYFVPETKAFFVGNQQLAVARIGEAVAAKLKNKVT